MEMHGEISMAKADLYSWVGSLLDIKCIGELRSHEAPRVAIILSILFAKIRRRGDKLQRAVIRTEYKKIIEDRRQSADILPISIF